MSTVTNILSGLQAKPCRGVSACLACHTVCTRPDCRASPSQVVASLLSSGLQPAMNANLTYTPSTPPVDISYLVRTKARHEYFSRVLGFRIHLIISFKLLVIRPSRAM